MRNFERLKREAEAELDTGAIWEAEYKLVLQKEIAQEVKRRAREQAEADIRQRRVADQEISR